jgi:hypothetical protein
MECVSDEKKSSYRTRAGMSRTIAEEKLQQATRRVEITQHSDQKAEIVKAARRKFRAYEVECVSSG